MLKNTPPGQLSDLFGSMVDSSFEEKLSILTTVDLKERLQKVIELMKRQIQVLSISQELQTSIENKIGKKQREFLLREQLAAIKKELGETEDENDDEMSDIGKRVQNAKLSPDARKVANKELRRLKNMQPNMAEHQVIRTYLEWIIELPWEKSSEDSLDISKARKVLDADHQGLQKVKTRIVEYLAVRKLNKSLKGPILCLAGPPGVGKTSLGKSIANSLGRQFYRIALGGVRDEAEIRGHRRTYVGALPGLIIHAMHKCGVNNPVILLDEIDKISRDVRGDPSSALLEVLDPEQNHTFTDHYLNIPFDLSKVLFIATANDLSTIPAPLLDRMEMIEIPGYTLDEKVAIAREHLLPKQIKNHGLQPDLLQMSDAIISRISSQYTRESGVRNLEREIATVCRSQTLLYSDAMENDRLQFFKPTIDMDRLESILGQPKFTDEVSERTQTPGVVTGLAYTGNGSGGMLFIEATSVPGHGKLKLTGKLGDVIRESCEIGLTFVKANQSKLQIDFDFDKHDLHIHFPAGATPKDGPSAGVTIATAIISLLTKTPVIHHLAMTGELSLRGLVLPVGGIKEKLLAAHLGKIERVCVPEKNKKDLEDVPLRIRQDLNIILCRTIWDVLRAAFPDNQRYLQYGNLSSL
ncbi:Lon protease C-terminal proteolytic domain-containing protein [Gorgonomyces haynaldii]|nr:Lon protease C-terminal proteolytic domain-containing protein [Gorgonomyces haynaldii]